MMRPVVVGIISWLIRAPPSGAPLRRLRELDSQRREKAARWTF